MISFFLDIRRPSFYPTFLDATLQRFRTLEAVPKSVKNKFGAAPSNSRTQRRGCSFCRLRTRKLTPSKKHASSCTSLNLKLQPLSEDF